MSDLEVTTGSAAIIKVIDVPTREQIYLTMQGQMDKPIKVEFRPDEETIALMFNDGGEVLIGVAAHMTELKSVQDSGGTYYIYAARPASVPISMGPGGPSEPPPPDTMCPCSGP